MLITDKKKPFIVNLGFFPLLQIKYLQFSVNCTRMEKSKFDGNKVLKDWSGVNNWIKWFWTAAVPSSFQSFWAMRPCPVNGMYFSTDLPPSTPGVVSFEKHSSIFCNQKTFFHKKIKKNHLHLHLFIFFSPRPADHWLLHPILQIQPKNFAGLEGYNVANNPVLR